MNKVQFFNKLRYAATSLPNSEIDKLIDYFSEIIDDRIEDGFSEEEIIATFPDVSEIIEKAIDEMGTAPSFKSYSSADSYSGADIFETADKSKENPEQDSPPKPLYKTEVFPASQAMEIVFISKRKIAVEFISAADNMISVKYKNDEFTSISTSVSGGTFTIEHICERPWYQIWELVNSKVTVAIPKNILAKLLINLNNAKVDVKNLDLHKLAISGGNLVIDADDVICSDFSVNVKNTNFSCDNLTTDELSVKINIGNFGFSKIQADKISLNMTNGIINGKIDGDRNDFSILTTVRNGSNNVGNSKGINPTKSLDASVTNGMLFIDFNKISEAAVPDSDDSPSDDHDEF